MTSGIELPISEYDDQCAITQETLYSIAKRKELVAIACGHKFSMIEIATWLEQKPSCPMCRKHIRDKNMVPVVLKTAKIVQERLAYSHSSQRNLNGDFTPEEALKIALQASQGAGASSSSSSIQNPNPALKHINGDLTPSEALQIALKGSADEAPQAAGGASSSSSAAAASSSARERAAAVAKSINGDFTAEEALQIALTSSSREGAFA